MTNYPTFTPAEASHLRDQFALAIVQGYISRNSMPGTQNRDQFLENVWELAGQLVAAQSPKKKP